MTRAIALVVATALGTALLAQAPALDIKLGLWENSVTIGMDGLPPGIDTSKMTAEQKAAMAAAMKGGFGGKTIVEKTCMTREKLQSDAFMSNQPNGMKCTRVLVTNTRTEYVADLTCTGEQPMSGRVSIQAADSSSFKGTMKMTSAQRGGMNMTMAMSGKWLSADCGAIK